MAWRTFHTEVKITAGGVSYTLPVDSLTVKAIPYSGSGSIAVELFDGRRVQRIDGWRYEVTISWRYLHPEQHAAVYNAIVALATYGGGTLDVDPKREGGKAKLLSVILSDADDAIQAVFDGMVRQRPSSFTLVSTNVDAAPVNWIHL